MDAYEACLGSDKHAIRSDVRQSARESEAQPSRFANHPTIPNDDPAYLEVNI